MPVSASNEKDPSEPTRHSERFYLSDTGMAIFKVENRLYKVHRYFLIRESAIFASMFADCPPPGDGQDGDTDEKPINLPYTTCAEFEALLEFLYDGMQFMLKFLKKVNLQPLRGSKKTFASIIAYAREEEKIFSLFDIADRYELDNIKKQLVAFIDASEVHIDPIRKLLIGCKNDDARHWEKPAFDEIVKRPNSLTLEEMRSLGFERVAEICSARESFCKENQALISWGEF